MNFITASLYLLYLFNRDFFLLNSIPYNNSALPVYYSTLNTPEKTTHILYNYTTKLPYMEAALDTYNFPQHIQTEPSGARKDASLQRN